MTDILDSESRADLIKYRLEKALLTHSDRTHATEGAQFLDSVHAIKKAIDPTVVDTSDPRTNYIMSK